MAYDEAAGERHMRRAMELAGDAAAAGDVPVGAVLVCGELVLEAKNEKEFRPDATAFSCTTAPDRWCVRATSARAWSACAKGMAPCSRFPLWIRSKA